MDGPDVPTFFICPISLQIMKDPVTISTGMTYDRESIQKWLFSYNNTTCPVTKLPLTNHSLTPNSTLLRLIQSWCINNQSKSTSKIDSPNPTVEFSAILRNLIKEVREPNSQIKSLRKMKSLIQENGDNKLFLEEAGVTLLVSSLITQTNLEGIIHNSDKSLMLEEAMAVLYLLTSSSETLKKVSEDKNGLLIESLSLVIQHGSYQARIQSALILKYIFKVVDDKYKAVLHAELFFEGITEILKDNNSIRGSKAVLSILMEVIPFGRNLIKAVEAGVVSVIVELLAESNEKQACEIMLVVLELLCGRAEGRSAFLAHPAGMATVATKILMVSEIANDKAVRVLLLVCRFCKGDGVVQELLEVGGVAKLCMVMQAECRMKTKEKAKEILGFHLKAWIKSPCFSSCFIH